MIILLRIPESGIIIFICFQFAFGALDPQPLSPWHAYEYSDIFRDGAMYQVLFSSLRRLASTPWMVAHATRKSKMQEADAYQPPLTGEKSKKVGADDRESPKNL